MSRPGPCGGLNEKCPQWAWTFEHLVPGCQCCSGSGGSSGRRNLAGGRMSLGGGLWVHTLPTSCLLSLLSERDEDVVSRFSLLQPHLPGHCGLFCKLPCSWCFLTVQRVTDVPLVCAPHTQRKANLTKPMPWKGKTWLREQTELLGLKAPARSLALATGCVPVSIGAPRHLAPLQKPRCLS